MYKQKKIKLIDERIIELKKMYFYSRKMSGGKRSREIEKEGYSFFKPKLDNIKNDFEYDIKSELNNLITKKEILNHFNNKKDFKEYYEGLTLKGLIEPKIMENNKEPKQKVVDSDLNLLNNKNECSDCIELFGRNMKDLIHNFNKNNISIHEKITDYYQLLLKAYSFDYMTDPSISNQHRIQKLTECYNKIINNNCKLKNQDVINYFTIDIKNNLELINNILN